MHKRYLPIAVVTGLLCVLALVGYVMPEGQKGLPVRTLLENKGGKVIFNHSSHSEDMQNDCVV